MWSQTIQAEVKFHNLQLSNEEQVYLQGLDRELTQLINNYPWVDRTYKYELPIQIDIFLERYSLSTGYHRYGGGIMMALPSGIQMRDRRWDSRFSREEHLHFGDPYDPLTGFIEFYIWICLGFERDRLTPLGGQPFYEKARMISDNARFESTYFTGWDNRRDLVHQMAQDTVYRRIRTAAYHAYAGIYYVRNQDELQARSHLIYAAELLMAGEPKMMVCHLNDHVIRFVDVDQFVAALKKIREFDTLDRLAAWDSEHSNIYH